MSERNDFPKYLVRINGKRYFLSFQETYRAHEASFSTFEFGEYVLEEDFSVRHMTEEDTRKIYLVATEYSASK